MSIWGRLAGAAAELAESAHIGGPVRGLLGAFAAEGVRPHGEEKYFNSGTYIVQAVDTHT